MELTDKIWKEIEGGYRTLYDPSTSLKLLEIATDQKSINRIWEELWNELHHQGDVGLASYLALPQLVKICKSRDIYDWNLLGICCVIEQQRNVGSNPKLPKEFSEYYFNGIFELKKFVITKLNTNLDDSTYSLSLAALATCKQQIKLGKAIMELEDKDILEEFLNQF